MTFIRTVLGDIAPEELGVTYGHEHLVIDGGRPVLLEPEFDLGGRRGDGDRGERGGRIRGSVRSLMPCPATPGRMLRCWPGSRAAPASMSSHPPGSTTTGITARLTGVIGCRSRSSRTCSSRTSDGIDAYDYAGPVVQDSVPCRGDQGRRLGGRAVSPRRSHLRGRGRDPPDRASILTHCEHGTGAWSRSASSVITGFAGAYRAESRRPGRGPRVPPRAARDRGLRRI